MVLGSHVFTLPMHIPGQTLGHGPLVHRVIPEIEKLAHYLQARSASKAVMIHGVGDELLDALDLGGSVESQLIVHIHVIEVGGGVDRHLVPGQLSLVVEGRPVGGVCEDLSHLSNILQLVV